MSDTKTKVPRPGYVKLPGGKWKPVDDLGALDAEELAAHGASVATDEWMEAAREAARENADQSSERMSPNRAERRANEARARRR